ncbi:MAG: MCE family protein [Flavobacteriales bacterium]|nr:MCE family protein [Flavobacteriales bacterium]
MKISNETKVGVLAAIAITILIVGYNFMKGENLFTSNNVFYARYETVDGLFRSNPVVINGYTVGQVKSVEMDPTTLNLIVGIQIPETIKVPKNSILKLTNNDLLGSKAIELIMGDTNVLAVSGDTLVSKKDAGMAQAITNILTPLTEQVKTILGKADTALTDVSVQHTLSELNTTLRSFAKTSNDVDQLLQGKSQKINGILTNIESVTADLKSGSPKIKEIVASLEKTASELEKLDFDELSTQLNATITEIQTTLKAIQEGQGSLGKLANDDELWNNLTAATKSLDSLAKDMQRYPRRYLGITEKQRKKGDKQKEFNEGVDLPDEVKP